MTNFSRRISPLVDDYGKRAEKVLRQSVQDTVNTASQTREKGGRMRVDTGFLKASGGAALNALPTGPTSQDDAVDAGNSQTGESLTLILGRWEPGDTIFYGWTANYARVRESKDGFLRGATEKWADTVNKNARKAKSRGL